MCRVVVVLVCKQLKNSYLNEIRDGNLKLLEVPSMDFPKPLYSAVSLHMQTEAMRKTTLRDYKCQAWIFLNAAVPYDLKMPCFSSKKSAWQASVLQALRGCGPYPVLCHKIQTN